LHLRGTREDAWKRAIAFYRKKNKPPSEAFVAFIEFGPDLLSVELGEPPYRFRLNDTLHMKLVTSRCVPLYTIYLSLESK
jgi:hypothetical protein